MNPAMENAYANDETLIRDIRNRENRAFEYIHAKCFDVVRIQVANLSGTEEDAEDIYNENIAGLITVIDDPNLNMKCKVTSLFLVMCKNQLVTEINKKEAAGRFLQINDETTYEEDFETKLDALFYQNIFWNSFEKMKRDCKKIMRKFLNGMTLKEIASTMALSYVYVRKKKHYCYKSLLEHVYANQDYRQLKFET